jgi:hypothetical protein
MKLELSMDRLVNEPANKFGEHYDSNYAHYLGICAHEAKLHMPHKKALLSAHFPALKC